MKSPNPDRSRATPEPAIAMEELEQFSEKVARETVDYLTYLLEDELDDLYSRLGTPR